MRYELGLDYSIESANRASTCEDIISFLLENRTSIRECSENLEIPKSTVHHYIHTYIRYNYPEEYQEITNLLKFNSRYRTKPRRFW